MKAKVTTNEEKLALLDTEHEKLKNTTSDIVSMYKRFIGWADEFDNATFEQRKMIVGQIIKRVELDRGYKIHIEFNMDYEQFCSDWNDEREVV